MRCTISTRSPRFPRFPFHAPRAHPYTDPANRTFDKGQSDKFLADLRHAALEINCFIAIGVMPIGVYVFNGPGRASLRAGQALTASVLYRLIRGEESISENRSQPDTRPVLRIHKQKALSLPAQARGNGYRFVRYIRAPIRLIQHLRCGNREALAPARCRNWETRTATSSSSAFTLR